MKLWSFTENPWASERTTVCYTEPVLHGRENPTSLAQSGETDSGVSLMNEIFRKLTYGSF